MGWRIEFNDIRIGDEISSSDDGGGEIVTSIHPIDDDGGGQLNFHNGNLCPVGPDTELWWFSFTPDLANPWSPGACHDKWEDDYRAARRERQGGGHP